MKKTSLIFFILFSIYCHGQTDTTFNFIKYFVIRDTAFFNEYAKRYDEFIFIGNEVFNSTTFIYNSVSIRCLTQEKFDSFLNSSLQKKHLVIIPQFQFFTKNGIYYTLNFGLTENRLISMQFTRKYFISYKELNSFR